NQERNGRPPRLFIFIDIYHEFSESPTSRLYAVAQFFGFLNELCGFRKRLRNNATRSISRCLRLGMSQLRLPAPSLQKAQQSPCELMKEDRSPNCDHKSKPRAQQGFQAILAHPAQATKNY